MSTEKHIKIKYNRRRSLPGRGKPGITVFDLINYESIDVLYVDIYSFSKEISEAFKQEFTEGSYLYHLKENKWYKLPMVGEFIGLFIHDEEEEHLENFIFNLKEIIRLRNEIVSIEFEEEDIKITTVGEVLQYTNHRHYSTF